MAYQCNTEYSRSFELSLGEFITPICMLERGHEGDHESDPQYGPLRWPNLTPEVHG